MREINTSHSADDDPEMKSGLRNGVMQHPIVKQHLVPVVALVICITAFVVTLPLTQPRVSPKPKNWLLQMISLNETLSHVQTKMPQLQLALKAQIAALQKRQQQESASSDSGSFADAPQQQQQLSSSSPSSPAAVSVTDLRLKLQKEITLLANDVEDMFRAATSEAPVGRVGGGGGGGMNGAQSVSADCNPNLPPGEPVNLRPGGPYVAPVDVATSRMGATEKAQYQRDFVRDAFRHSWKGYHDFAWGTDELQPCTKNGKNWNPDNPYISLSLSLLDGLTTMHFMGLHRELDEALRYIEHRLSFDKHTAASTFEMMIRVVGSLLSMYELRGEKDKFLLKKARDIAGRLMFAFNTTSGLPHQTVHLITHHHSSPDWSGGASVLSEFGTVQLELRTLSFHTRDPSYDMRATHVMDIIEAKAPRDGLCPVFMGIGSANWITDHITLGALGDSFYEYVLKQYLLTGRTEKRYKRMFRKIANAVVDKLVFRTSMNEWAYTAEFRRNEFFHKQDHLACFFGGTLALAAHKLLDNSQQDPKEALEKERWMKVAGDLTTTCYEMYHQQKSGVSPEYVEFMASGGDFVNGQGYYILRPETMEALFYLWRFTKEQKYRDMGWEIFRAIDRWCRVESGGFAGLSEVNVRRPTKDNLQQSFWLAETLKYSYLLFCDDGVIDLDEWVFNTEAHPFRIRKRDPLDVWREYEDNNEGRLPWMPPRVSGVAGTEHATETERMKRRRESGGYQRASGKDEFSEEFDSGAADDEGMPFEPHRGMKGVPRLSRNLRSTWFGPQPLNVAYDEDFDEDGRLRPGSKLNGGPQALATMNLDDYRLSQPAHASVPLSAEYLKKQKQIIEEQFQTQRQQGQKVENNGKKASTAAAAAAAVENKQQQQPNNYNGLSPQTQFQLQMEENQRKQVEQLVRDRDSANKRNGDDGGKRPASFAAKYRGAFHIAKKKEE